MRYDKKYLDLEVDEIGQVLLDAADYLEEHGWCQGSFRRSNGTVCATMAISEAAARYDQSLAPLAHDRLGRYMPPNTSLGIFCLMLWNDHKDRTKAEVVEAFRNAARTRL